MLLLVTFITFLMLVCFVNTYLGTATRTLAVVSLYVNVLIVCLIMGTVGSGWKFM